MSRETSRGLIGRQTELAALYDALGEARRGQGHVALVGGEAGIGKTRLAQELAAVADTEGVTVLWGRCVEGGAAPPYWPWAQIIGSFAAGCPADSLRDVLGPSASRLAIIVPQLHARIRIRRTAPDTESDRFRLFDAVRTFLQRASLQASLLLVLEDLHWADQRSLLLLELLAQELSGQNVLIVATYRDGEAPPPLTQTLGELGRVGPSGSPLAGCLRKTRVTSSLASPGSSRRTRSSS